VSTNRKEIIGEKQRGTSTTEMPPGAYSSGGLPNYLAASVVPIKKGCSIKF